MSTSDRPQDAKEHFLKNLEAARAAKAAAAAKDVPLPSVGRIVHYYGKLHVDHPDVSGAKAVVDGGPFAALVVDVGPEPTTVTLKITDRMGYDHVRANVKYGDPGWMWPPRVG
jgi:hypothetical protein